MIDLQGINKTYAMGEVVVPVLKDIDLTIVRGEYTAIMGASGSGQSTLMNIIGCLDRPSYFGPLSLNLEPKDLARIK